MSNTRINWLRIAIGTLLIFFSPIAYIHDTSPSASAESPAPIADGKKHHPKQVARVKQKVTALRARFPGRAIDLAQTPPPPSATDSRQPTPVPSVAPEPPNTPTPNPAAERVRGTELAGEAIFGIAGSAFGDFSQNPTFGYRVRLELRTSFSGKDLLTTRLQAVNQGLPNNQVGGVTIPEGSLAWTDGTTEGTIKVDALNYQFPIDDRTLVVVDAHAGQANDFTDTVNPLFDGDGGSGSISLYGTRAPIYYTVQGTGVGVRHKLTDTTELSLGYLARAANSPSAGSGLFGGGYGAIAQLTFQPSTSSKVALTYTRAYDSDSGTGSINANLGGNSNNYGVQGYVQLDPKFALGGWVGYTQNQLAGADRQLWNWAITAAASDLGGTGNLAGILVGQEPRVTADGNANTADTKVGLHIEGFYQIKVSDRLIITPGIIYLTAPNQDANSRGTAIGVLRSTFIF